MRQLRSFTPSSGLFLRATSLAILLLGLFGAPIAGRAIDTAITQSIWKMVYNVTDAQMGSAAWLAADDDHDGISNGAEAAAGTDPFSAGSTVNISSMTVVGENVNLTFPTIAQKQYFIQSTTTLGSPGSWLPSGASLPPTPGSSWVKGDGTSKTLSIAQSPGTYYRVVVQDLDTDGDGVSDWAETIAGYDPNSSNTSGVAGGNDHTALTAAVAASNVVTVTVTKPSATQPVDALTAPVETGSITVSRTGLLLSTITVPLLKSGSATEGLDYDALPATVTLSGSSLPYNPANPNVNKKVGEVVLAINPKGPTVPANARRTNVTAIVKALPADTAGGSGNYTLGGITSGSVVINPPGLANGTGLTGKYFNTSSSTYSPTQVSIYGGTVAMSRTDATVDFTNGVNGWGSTGGPTGMSPASATTAFSVRWTGQILPQYSETYTIDFRSDDSAKVWVNGQLLIDRWVGQTATDYVNTIALTAGVLYDIQIDYWNSSGSAEARLYWWSPSQTKQIIPQNRLFPAPTQAGKVTAVTSSLAAVGYEGVPFSFNVTSPDIGGGKTYARDPNSGLFPSGLGLDPTTGVITGTPAAGTAGTYNVAINVTNTAGGTVTGSSIVNITIFPSGGVTRELLAASGGDRVSDIVIPFGTPTHDTIATIDDDTDYGHIGERLRGYIVPPKTGNYYFWIAANNAAELWISNDSEYVNRVRRAYVTGGSAKKEWTKAVVQPSQQSPWIAMVAGQKYYFEVLHNTGSDADDHVAVGWCQDDIGTIPSVTGSPNPNGALPVIPNGGGARQGFPLSGTVPAYVCQPYDYPAVTPPTGKLYAANLGPQGSSSTKASGSANIQVDAGETQAILHFDYQNLTSPRTAYHLHVDSFTSAVAPFTVHPQAEIIFDIDDADAAPPELRTADGGYVWIFGPTGSFLSAAQIVEAIHQGKVYLNIHSVTYPAGEIRGNLSLIDGSQTPPDSSSYPEPTATDLATTDAGAARFLNHATFGASNQLFGNAIKGDIDYVKLNGFVGWINDQLTKTPTHTSNDVVAGITADINSPYPSALFTNTWWKNSITAPDQLRQRLAFALSEIMVVSWANDTGNLQNNGRILADYYDQLVDYSLPTAGLADSGTFRGLLKAVTLTPAMGLYLDMRANQKGDDSIGRHPNENYAREIMQLFSVGIYRLWDDGRYVLGSNAGLVATYAQPQILGLAALFTGWNYAQANQANGRLPTNFGPAADYLNPMVLVPTQHDLGPKALLNNVVTPAATGLTPRVAISSIAVGNPCTVNTSTVHGLTTGDTAVISGVTTGTFTGGLTAINNAFTVTVTSPTSFTVPANCTAAAAAGGSVTGATVKQPTYTSATVIPAITGSQADNAGSTVPHPYDQYGLTELDRAIDNIVNNDNVPPYICRQLIQRFVTSDPSPGYLYRVVQKFKDNGSGVRGDMAAVVTQILTDGEARSSSVTQNSAGFGKQREPIMRLTGPARAFATTNYTGTYSQLTGINANKLRIVTSTPNDFSSSFNVSLDFHGNYSPAGQTLTPGTVPTSTTYTVQTTLGISSTSTAITSIALGSPAVITSASPHGLVTGNTVTISSVTGGTFSPAINGTFTATVINATQFSVPSNCTVVPTSLATAKFVSNPCKVTTAQAHGLTTGDSVTITGVSGGTFSPTINGTFPVTVVDSTSFTIASNCTAASTVNTGTIVGANTLDVNATGMVTATYTQTAGSTTMTVNTAGPPTDITVPGTATVIKSKVYMTVLSRTAALGITSIATGNPCTITKVNHGLITGDSVTISGVTGGTFSPSINGTYTVTVVSPDTFTVASNCTVAPTAGTGTATGSFGPTAADGVYQVQTTPSNQFTVITADTPTATRTGTVLIPKIATSYTPQSGNTVVQYNTNVNHNLAAGNQIWVDVPVIGTPVADAEYTITTVTDEDHFKTSYQPTNLNGGTYPLPSGSTNSVTIWPLVPVPFGRSGVVTINQSTFSLGSTESTLTQSPLNAPTVFNFFFPDYKFPGSLANNGLDSPEFQLTTDTNVLNLTNSLTNMIIGTGGGNGNLNGLLSFNNGSGAVVLSVGSYMSNGKTSEGGIPNLVDELAILLTGATLDPATKTTIVNFVNHKNGSVLDYLPYTTPTNQQKRDRVRAIIHLIITSAEYAVQK